MAASGPVDAFQLACDWPEAAFVLYELISR